MMRADYDAAAKWTPFPQWEGARLQRRGWSARAVAGLRQTLVSGDLEGVRAALPGPLPEAGLWAVEPARTLLLRLARDRALIVSDAPIPLAPGWQAAGWAASPADAFLVFELSGENLIAPVREAVSAGLEAGSPSAAVLFAGVPAFLYRTAPDTARLHVEAPLAPFVWRWLDLRPDRRGDR